MVKEHINPTTLFPSLQHGFSQIVTARGGSIVFISGQTGWDSAKRIIGARNLGEQTRQALRNIRTALETVGGTLADVVSLRIYVVNYKREDADAIGEAMREFFSADKPPASTLIGVSSLAVEEFMIEIEAIAVVD